MARVARREDVESRLRLRHEMWDASRKAKKTEGRDHAKWGRNGG